MTAEGVRGALRARPFRPFILELVDGQKLSVRHPEFVMFSQNCRTIAVAGDGGGFKIVDVFLIQTIDLRKGKVTAKTRRPR